MSKKFNRCYLWPAEAGVAWQGRANEGIDQILVIEILRVLLERELPSRSFLSQTAFVRHEMVQIAV